MNGCTDYYDVISYYYEVIGKGGLKGKYSEKRYSKLLRKLDEWENVHTDNLYEMGA